MCGGTLVYPDGEQGLTAGVALLAYSLNPPLC